MLLAPYVHTQYCTHYRSIFPYALSFEKGIYTQEVMISQNSTMSQNKNTIYNHQDHVVFTLYDKDNNLVGSKYLSVLLLDMVTVHPYWLGREALS